MINSKMRMNLALTTAIAIALSACAKEVDEQTSQVDSSTDTPTSVVVEPKPKSSSYDGTVAKPGSPYSISYRIVGTPLVGSPVVVDLRVASTLGPQPVNLDFRINDASSLVFGESQPATIQLEMADNESSVKQQVTVIPQREGRFYLNVSASFEDSSGTQSTVMAVPIQVGTGGRELEQNGTVELDENGDAVRVLTTE